jgi:hypothetical protein
LKDWSRTSRIPHFVSGFRPGNLPLSGSVLAAIGACPAYSSGNAENVTWIMAKDRQVATAWVTMCQQ